ncbi:MAG TPA: copper amine oxidase N-terminal domain-containing protein [bacterium]|nr:copper amine oxidase N-terminal domain-containing protein [bacterium]
MNRTRAVWIALALVAAISVAAPMPSGAQGVIRVFVDGQPVNFDVPPTVIQGRVLVPLRGIFERLGATVDYNAANQHILAVRGGQTVELTVGSRQAAVNTQPQLLDVPAFTINGRTMVPLRFISEALGAGVQWNAANATILINSGGGAPTAAAPPVTPSGEVTGRLMAVTTGQNPQVVVRANNQDYTYTVSPQTAIYRFNAATNAGGSAPLGALHAGDQVVVDASGNQATKITATYRVVPAGRIASINAGNRTVTLANGQRYVVLPDAVITLNGQAADFSALQNGRAARFSVVQGTNQAYEVAVTTPAAATPVPTALTAPTITSPGNGQRVGTSVTVQGQAQPGALVVVTAQPRLLGQVVRVSTTANANGAWQVALNLTSIPLVGTPYVVSAAQIVNGAQSDAASIEVNVQ